MKNNFVFIVLILTCLSTRAQLKILSNGYVGINNDEPSVQLHINGDVRGNQLNGSLRISTNYRYVDIGCNHWSCDHTHFITNSDYGFYFNMGIEVVGGSYSSFTGDLTLATQRSKKVWIKENGYVGIGDATPSYMLDVNGDIATYGILRISSDERLKKNIIDIDEQKINNLYNLQAKIYIKDNSLLEMENEIITIHSDTSTVEDFIKVKIDSTPKIGFIAQQLKEYFPDLVSQDNKGFYNIDYISLIPVLVESVKNQHKRINYLEEEIKKNYSNNNKTEYIYLNNNDYQSENNCILYQNSPNPFNLGTQIRFQIPEEVNNSVIYIYDLQGKQIRSYNIEERGESSLIINGYELYPGIYLYTLITDGKVIGTKRMILTKD